MSVGRGKRVEWGILSRTILYRRCVAMVTCCMVMNLSLVNYRGSGGFGQDSVFSLLGKIGTQEVRDVHVSSKL